MIQLVTAKTGKARVLRLEIPAALQKFNTDNNTLRVRIVACWASDDKDGGVQSLLRSVVGNNEFSQIANLDGYVVPDNPNADAQTKVNAFKAAVVGGEFFATKYSVTISNLAKNLGEKYATLERVHDPIRKRTYTSLTDCTLDNVSDDDKAVMYERLSNRLAKRLADGRLKVGTFVEPATSTPPNLGASTGADIKL